MSYLSAVAAGVSDYLNDTMFPRLSVVMRVVLFPAALVCALRTAHIYRG